jgi:glycosyltransferase involved in cell wall biosynthesis
MRQRDGVLIIVQNLPVPYDRRVWSEAQTLRDAGEPVIVICPTGQDDDYLERYAYTEGVHIYRYPAPPEVHSKPGYLFEFTYCWLWTAALALWIFLRHGFNVIHACNPPETYFLLAACFKPFGVRFVFDHHDLSPELYLAKGGRPNGLLHRGLLWLERRTLRTADIVLTTNETQRQIAQARSSKPHEVFYIVRNSPRSTQLYPVAPEPALKCGRPYLVCYLGEMGSQDGVEFLLRLVQHITQQQQREDVYFALLGGGPIFTHVQHQVLTFGLQQTLTLTGRVGDGVIRRYLSTADVCVVPDLPSAFNHACNMNKVMEYMIFGKPIVAFDLHENRVSAQNAAVYVQEHSVDAFAAEILHLLNDPQRRQAMGAYGRQRVLTDLAWERSAAQLLRAYEVVRA